MRHNLRFLLGLLFALSLTPVAAQPTVRLDATKTHQHITGFGGFVCSPQFQYNHMSTTDIKKVWGPTSTVGCNIMRLYIPIGRNAWSQSLATAKNAKQMGLIVFASPWGQPAEWKTNNSINAKTDDGKEGRLKREHWADYAKYLEDYVQYMRQNGVELDAISIQNEPDWPAGYAGCLWSASEIAEFVKTYGPSISCKVMAPETLAVSDSYANALNKSDVLPCFDIYGGHQYGGIQSAYKNLAAKGKELWMTEYLINWNEGQSTTRNFDFSQDFFNFFTAINTCMLGDFNAWIHYAAKRYYGMLGDGQYGAGSTGVVTKRGYVMAHFAKYVTGMTRIDIDLSATPLEGSAYLSASGDTVVAVLANATDEVVAMTMDLPFYTQMGKQCTTTKGRNFTTTTLKLEGESCRPVVSMPALSVSTVLFVKSRDRQPSDMKGSATRFDRLDDMVPTKTSFGTTYKLSGKTKTFDASNPLISTRTALGYGYLALANRYTQLVMQVKKVTSTGNLTAGTTTLTYVNAKGAVSTHDYGRIDLGRAENFSLVFDLSPATLADGCIGLLSLKCDNTYSHLTITFADVYLSTGSTPLYAATLSGIYVADDSYVQEYMGDASCTSLDLSACVGVPSQLPWLSGTNRVAWLPEGSTVSGPNLVHAGVCHELALSDDGGAFRPVSSFQAEKATFTTTVDGCRMLMLPFAAAVPDGAKAYSLDGDLQAEELSTIPAHTPVLIQANGEVVLSGQGETGYAVSPLTATFRGTYTPAPLYSGDYVLAQQDGQWGFSRVDTPAVLSPFDVYATLPGQASFLPLAVQVGIVSVTSSSPRSAAVYDIQGRRVNDASLAPGLYIKNGKKILRR